MEIIKLKAMVVLDHQQHFPKKEFDLGKIYDYSESPQRINQIQSAIEKIEGFQYISQQYNQDQFWQILNSIHTSEYLHAFEHFSEVAQEKGDYLYPEVFPRRLQNNNTSEHLGYYSIDNYAPIGANSYKIALKAAQTAYSCALEIEKDPSAPVYALIRPPGHHAGPDYMGGYCYLNNAAVAARHLQKSGRVALLDIDYHHGNGTQEIFWDDPQVLYLSIHGDPDYPNYSGTKDEKGGISALHANHNIPLPERTVGEQYLQAFEQALETIHKFDPSWLIISLGVDTFKDDHVGNFALDLIDYAAIGEKLKETKLPLLFIQEGGYNIKEVGNLVAELLKNAC